MASDREGIFRNLVGNLAERDRYTDRLPGDISGAFVNNGYVDNLLHERDLLIRHIFGDGTEAVEWFLYEWRPGWGVTVDGVERVFQTVDDYVEYLRECGYLGG